MSATELSPDARRLEELRAHQRNGTGQPYTLNQFVANIKNGQINADNLDVWLDYLAAGEKMSLETLKNEVIEELIFGGYEVSRMDVVVLEKLGLHMATAT